jgi:hypothetical protein
MPIALSAAGYGGELIVRQIIGPAVVSPVIDLHLLGHE